MTPGSPFSNVLGKDPGNSTFTNVESTQTSDTTSETAGRPDDSPTESSVPVEVTQDHTVHQSGQDETAGEGGSGGYTAST